MIKFYSKIVAQHGLSVLPGGASLYAWAQRHVTGSIIPRMAQVQQRIDVACNYLEMFEKVGIGDDLKDEILVDYGAGWHFTVPLLFYQWGWNRQVLVDIQRGAEADIVFGVADLLRQADAGPHTRRPLPMPEGRSLDDYLETIGVEYRAPVPSAELPLADGSVSLVTATQSLLHPPPDAIPGIFAEIARILKPGGYFIAIIHLYDLYSDADGSLSRFNFLRYSRAVWERYFNSKQMTYNRLRASDFGRVVDALPFDREIWDVEHPTEAEIAAIRRLPPHEEYAGYELEDLGSSHLTFVLRRR